MSKIVSIVSGQRARAGGPCRAGPGSPVAGPTRAEFERTAREKGAPAALPVSEYGFQEALGPEKIQTTRVSTALAALLYTLFGALDLWAIPSALQRVWMIRGAVLVLLAAIFLSTYRPFFVRHYTALTTVMYLGVGAGIEAMIYLAAPDELARTVYYSGLILVVYALYTWTYLSASISLAIGLSLVSTYLWIAVAVQRLDTAQDWPVLLANSFFFISASVIGFVGGGMRNRFARESVRLRHALERELEQTIAERRQNELAYLRKLQDSEALKTAIIDTAPVSLVTVDGDARILEFNPCAERCFSCARHAAIGRTLDAFVELPGADPRNAAPLDPGRLPNGPAEAVGIRADGTRFPIELAVAPTRLGDADIYTAFIVDLTHKRQAEEEIHRQRETLSQREKLAAMGSLLAGVAHELNNPLAVVVGRSMLLEEQVADGPLRDPVGKIRQAADRCARIVRTFLAMARQQRSARGPVDFNRTIEAALDMLAYPLRTAGIEIDLQLTPDLPTLPGDEDQLLQVVMNLIVNAQQAMADQHGPRRLSISTRHETLRRRVCAAVSDTGPGIAPANRSRVFEPFFTTKPEGQGTGVGLAVCLGIVEAHGGSLRFDCPQGGGTCFTLELPVSGAAGDESSPPILDSPLTDEEERRGPAALREAPSHSGEHTASVLVVDDEPELAAMLQEMLAPIADRVDIAGNGREALACLERCDYAAVLTDLRMPELDGPGLHRAIEQRWPHLSARVVFLSGDTLSLGMRQFLEEKHCAVIEKPFHAREVRQRMAALLASSRTEAASRPENPA